MFKTIFDRTVAFCALAVLFLPVFVPVWLLIHLTSKGGAIYSQTRIGKGCKPFKLYKFRSMVANADKQGFQTNDGDSRITPIGRFLRKTSIDELPQLWNVLIGDMSLVGPRPDTPMQQPLYAEADWIMRHSVKPGITGLAQVNGRSLPTLQERLHYDLEYAKSASFLLDLTIIAKTLLVAAGKNIT